MTSSRPYLIRAMYDWITDNQLTPHIVVNAQAADVQVPDKFVVDGKIVLNISAQATHKLLINNESVQFDARFGTGIWHVFAPISSVLAVYARENGRGMVFEDEEELPIGNESEGEGDPREPVPPTKPPKRSKPQLKIVK